MIRGKVQALAESRGEWAGYPLPIAGMKLVVEPRHPLHKTMHGAVLPRPPEPDAPSSAISNNGDGRKLGTEGVAAIRRWGFWMNTLGVAADAVWSVDAELMAMTKLRAMVSDQAWKCYVLCGCFLETSQRSRVTYMFRKNRPTIAMRATSGGAIAPIAVLCLHPIAYYEDSWAGAMVPTDDVIAHLTLMRGDERRFWGKCNHHDIRSPASGL